MKELIWEGNSKEAVRDFPLDARQDAGYQLDKVQRGQDPDHWKPMTTVGSGVREIIISEEPGEFRVLYVTNIGNNVHVLHAFQKKTQQTSKHDKDIASARLRNIKR